MKSGITILILNKNDSEIVTEFTCLLGHPVYFALLTNVLSEENILKLKSSNVCPDVFLHDLNNLPWNLHLLSQIIQLLKNPADLFFFIGL